MREISVSQVTDVVEKLCIEANNHLPEDVKCAIRKCRECEDGEIAKGVLDNIIENLVNKLPNDLLTAKHKEYIIIYLKTRRNILMNIK